MTIAFDAFSNGTNGSTGNISWTHTPTGTPKGVVVFVTQHHNASDQVISVTYGGYTMTRYDAKFQSGDGHGVGAIYAYFLGSSVPSGAQTVYVTVDGTGSKKCAGCYTLTSDNDTAIESEEYINDPSAAAPSETIYLNSKTCAVVEGFICGQGSTGQFAPLSGWTQDLEYAVVGQEGSGIYEYNTIDSSDVTWGWTTSESRLQCGICLAIRDDEAPSAASNPDPEDDETNVEVDKILSWDGDGDTYDVYLGTSSPLDSEDLVSEGQAGETYDPPGDLDYEEEYFWRIDTNKSGYETVEGDEWSFTTKSESASGGGGNFFLIFS